MNLEEFHFDLPESQIATEPCEPRDHAKLLVCHRGSETFAHHHFHELKDLLSPGDLLVVNNSKVIPARLAAKNRSGRDFEVLLLRPLVDTLAKWECLIRPGKKIKPPGDLLIVGELPAKVSRLEDTFCIDFSSQFPSNFYGWLSTVGVPPLPPYIKRKTRAQDTQDYQTVYATENGSVAAPTAGLHFTERLLNELQTLGIDTAPVTLHVGYGTFSPLREENFLSGTLHEESYYLPDTTRESIEKTRARGGRVIAVGTTALRALESAAHWGSSGRTRLFIRPGYEFRCVDGLITNFHLPQSSLLLLVSAFLGKEQTLSAYQRAVEKGYRFYSYGDAMLILPS